MAIDINIPSQVKTFANLAGFPVTGAVKTIYIAEDTNKTYRWTGSVYVEISASGAGGSFVPYTGATGNVDLGTHTLSAKDLIINHSSGSGDAATITKGGSGEALKVIKTSGSGNAASITGGVTLLDELHLTTDLADSYISSAATWNDKQDELVSGTNIKTINGSSVLGSGDLVVGGGGASGIHAITALASGQSTYAGTTSQGFSSSSSVFNRLVACPFIPNQNITSSALYINVAGATPSGLARILIYSNLNGLPDQKLYESSDLNCSTIGIKTATTTFNFVAGTTYWLCLHNTPTFNVSLINSSGAIPLNVVAVTNPLTHLYMNVTFGSAPTTFGTPIYASGNPPFIGITKA